MAQGRLKDTTTLILHEEDGSYIQKHMRSTMETKA